MGFSRNGPCRGLPAESEQTLARTKSEYVSQTIDVRRTFTADQRAFLLERDDFSRYPLELRPITRAGVRMWYPSTINGGPAIETHFYFPYERDGRRIIPCSLIAHSRVIVNPTTRTKEPAGDAVKAAFNTLVAPLKRRFQRVRSAKRVA